MGGEQAAGVLATVRQDGLKAQGKEQMSAQQEADFKQPILDKYEEEGSAYYSTARLWDDGIIEPHKTREVLAAALKASKQASIEESKFGVFRM